MSGPLGEIQGMTFDPVKNRYFPTPPAAKAGTSTNAKTKQPGSQSDGLSAGRGRRARIRQPPEDRVSDLGEQTQGRTAKRLPKAPRGYTTSKGDSRRLFPAGTTSDTLPSSLDWKITDIRKHRLSARQRYYSEASMIYTHGDVQSNPHIECVSSVPGNPDSHVVGTSRGSIVSMKDDVDFHQSRLKVSGKDGMCLHRMQWKSLDLGSPITGLHCEADYYIATTAGPRPSLVVSREYPPFFSGWDRRQSNSTTPTCLISSLGMREAWAMSCKDDAIMIGGDRQFTYARDGETAFSRKNKVKTGSDVTAVKQVNMNEGYIGLRNGQIHHFDFRAPIVVSAVSAKHSMNGAVAGFEVVTNAFGCGRGLVTRALGKELCLVDMRFLRGPPAVTYDGYFNGYVSTMDMAVDPSETILLSGTLDELYGRIKCWDLYTGQSLFPDRTIHSTKKAEKLFDPKMAQKSFQPTISGISIKPNGLIYVAHGGNLDVFGKSLESVC